MMVGVLRKNRPLLARSLTVLALAVTLVGVILLFDQRAQRHGFVAEATSVDRLATPIDGAYKQVVSRLGSESEEILGLGNWVLMPIYDCYRYCGTGCRLVSSGPLPVRRCV